MLLLLNSYLGEMKKTETESDISNGESRIIFLPERSSIYQYRPEISAIVVKK